MSLPTEELPVRLAAIVATSDDAIISKDLTGIVQSWNASAERIFGYTAQEMIGQPITKIIPPDRQQEEPAILEKLKRGERVDHFQTIRVRKDGRRIDISVTISPIVDSTGRVIGASKIARDITEHRRLLRERESLYELGKILSTQNDVHAIVQAITDTATELSGAQFGAFFYNVINDAGEACTLYTLSGAPLEQFSKLPMPRNTQIFSSTFIGAGIVRSDDIAKDPRYRQNSPFRGMPGGHLPLKSYLAVPAFGRTGEVLGGLFFGHPDAAVFTDQSEAVVAAIAGHAGIALENARLNHDLTENMQRFQLLANSIPQLAWMARADGSLFWYNQRWYDYTGTSPDSQKGWGWETVHDPKELPRVIEKWKTHLASEEPWEDTFPLRRHDGVFRWHLSRAQPGRDASGKIIVWFGTNTDITEQRAFAREREELLGAERAARSEAERVSRMKDEFLSTISHELRTPLNAILGWSQLIQRTRNDPETLREGLAVIERNAKAQNQLIGDLLDMSRIISGKVRLEVQPLDLAPVIEAAIASVRPSADAKEIRLRTIHDPAAGPVLGDPSRIQQVVWNLLTNAIKFTPRQGEIEVRLERAESHVSITVTDTGQGIKPEFLPHVFDRFRQADASITREHGGLGLGLAIVKHLVELHGGAVHVRCDGPGKGAAFIVELPLDLSKPARDHALGISEGIAPGSERLSLAGLTVLVVDDEPDARDLIRRLLAERDATVVLAHSAHEAMDVLHSQTPDVLISDIGMPQTDGYEFIREVRKLPDEKSRRIPAVALTAFARSEDRTRAMMAGYQVHLSKPVEAQELVATVASVAGRTVPES